MAVMALPADVMSWLNEESDSADFELFLISSRVFTRLKERDASQEEIDNVFCSLAPLEFRAQHCGISPWACFFGPKYEANTDHREYSNLADLTPTHVDEWATLAEFLTLPLLKARFADAVWELGKRLGSRRNDLYRFGRLAAEMYLESARNCKHPIGKLNGATRTIGLGTQLKASDLIDQGYDFMMQYADSVELAQIGLWCAPLDRLLKLKGLSEAQKERILERHQQRFDETLATGDIFRITMVGQGFAKYFHDSQKYQRAKDITFAYGEAVLTHAGRLNASTATYHTTLVLEDYRRMGLKAETDRVRLLLEERAKALPAELKPRRVELKLDWDAIEEAIAEIINVPDPFIALYRLANNCAPTPEEIEQRFERMEGLTFHRLLPVTIIGNDGLTVTTVGTYDQDKEGVLVLEIARQMSLNAMFFLSGLEEWKKKFGLNGISDTPHFFESPLISADRASLFREGLIAFEAEDYAKCIHVLVFQIENSLRELLKALQLPVSKSTDNGYEPKNMNDVLYDPAVRDTLEPKLWFFLTVLYVDKRGMNLRNILAHSILPDSAFNKVNAALVIQSVIFLAAIR